MSADDPMPDRTGPAIDLYDWHYLRSLEAGISPEDAEILAESFVERNLR